MRSQKAEIKACVCHWLRELTDKPMADAGFIRRADSLVYSRKVKDAIQKIDVGIEHHPSERANAAAAVYPDYRIRIEQVNRLAYEMVAGDPQLGGDFATTLWGAIEWTGPKQGSARWYIYQPDSVRGVVSSLHDFVLKWTLPFLDKYATPADLCDAPLTGDRPTKAVHTHAQIIRVVAANVLLGKVAEAKEVMERWFGKLGPRRQYHRVFEYLDALQSKNGHNEE